MVESLITSLATLELSDDLTAMTQVAAAISAASSNPEKLSAKSVDAGIQFASKMAESLSKSESASLDEIAEIGGSLLVSVGPSLVSTSSTSSTGTGTSSASGSGSGSSATSQESSKTGEKKDENAPPEEKVVSPEDKTKLEEQANKIANTMNMLGNALLNKKVPGISIRLNRFTKKYDVVN